MTRYALRLLSLVALVATVPAFASDLDQFRAKGTTRPLAPQIVSGHDTYTVHEAGLDEVGFDQAGNLPDNQLQKDIIRARYIADAPAALVPAQPAPSAERLRAATEAYRAFLERVEGITTAPLPEQRVYDALGANGIEDRTLVMKKLAALYGTGVSLDQLKAQLSALGSALSAYTAACAGIDQHAATVTSLAPRIKGAAVRLEDVEAYEQAVRNLAQALGAAQGPLASALTALSALLPASVTSSGIAQVDAWTAQAAGQKSALQRYEVYVNATAAPLAQLVQVLDSRSTEGLVAGQRGAQRVLGTIDRKIASATALLDQMEQLADNFKKAGLDSRAVYYAKERARLNDLSRRSKDNINADPSLSLRLANEADALYRGLQEILPGMIPSILEGEIARLRASGAGNLDEAKNNLSRARINCENGNTIEGVMAFNAVANALATGQTLPRINKDGEEQLTKADMTVIVRNNPFSSPPAAALLAAALVLPALVVIIALRRKQIVTATPPAPKAQPTGVTLTEAEQHAA